MFVYLSLSFYDTIIQSVCLPVCLSVCLCIHPSVRPSVRPSICLSVCLSVCLSICLSVSLSIYLSVCRLPTTYLPSLSIYLSVCLSVVYPLPTYLPTYLICLSIYLYLSLSVCQYARIYCGLNHWHPNTKFLFFIWTWQLYRIQNLRLPGNGMISPGLETGWKNILYYFCRQGSSSTPPPPQTNGAVIAGPAVLIIDFSPRPFRKMSLKRTECIPKEPLSYFSTLFVWGAS
jgi:hypothetical protein